MNDLLDIKTENFDGPLDLFVYIIENKNLDMSKIILSDIIDEYLEIIEKEKNQNLKIKVEFLAMASEILEIKAYSVLNLEKKQEKEKKLGDKIFEYKIIKELATELLKMEVEYNIPYSLKGDKIKTKDNIFYTIDDLKLDLISNVYKELLENKKKEGNIKIEINDNFTTEDAFFEIHKTLKKEDKVEFSNLIKNEYSKNKLVSLFLAVLDLYKNGDIFIEVLEKDFIIRKAYNV